MTTARRTGVAVATLLSSVLVLGLVTQAWALRDALQQQHDARTRDAAAMLSMSLLSQAGSATGRPDSDSDGKPEPTQDARDRTADTVSLSADIERRFATGPYRRLAWRGREGATVIDLQRAPADGMAAIGFETLVPITETTVRENLGSRDVLLVQIDAAWARQAVWQAWSRTALWQTSLMALALALVLRVLGPARQRTLRSTSEPDSEPTKSSTFKETHASVSDAHDVLLDEAGRRGGDASTAFDMNARADTDAAAVLQLRQALQTQAAQVAALEQRALTDSLTGCTLRHHFIGQLQQRLAEPGGPGAALLLVRVLKLQALNLHHGRPSTDRLLQAVADVLLTYVDRVPGAFAGRLNGADFALCLPVPGVARETVTSLRAALTASPALRGGIARVVVGGVDGIHDISASKALTVADEALARAESAVDGTTDIVVDVNDVPSVGDAGGKAWREQIAAALADGRFRLASLSAVAAGGGLIHIECPLQVQLVAGGEFESAERWLALARRSRLLPEVDLAAVQAAFRAAGRDGIARAVHVSPVSLASTAYRAGVLTLLRSMPALARLIKLECIGVGPQDERTAAVLATAASAWRPLGMRIGIVHAGGTPQDLTALQSIGMDYVKVDARHLRGAAADLAMQGYARSLVELVHGLDMSVLAGGIDDAADLQLMWASGFDGATGPAVESAYRTLESRSG